MCVCCEVCEERKYHLGNVVEGEWVFGDIEDDSLKCFIATVKDPREGGTPYNGLYGEAPPERGTFFRLHVYKRVGI